MKKRNMIVCTLLSISLAANLILPAMAEDTTQTQSEMPQAPDGGQTPGQGGPGGNGGTPPEKPSGEAPSGAPNGEAPSGAPSGEAPSGAPDGQGGPGGQAPDGQGGPGGMGGPGGPSGSDRQNVPQPESEKFAVVEFGGQALQFVSGGGAVQGLFALLLELGLEPGKLAFGVQGEVSALIQAK